MNLVDVDADKLFEIAKEGYVQFCKCTGNPMVWERIPADIRSGFVAMTDVCISRYRQICQGSEDGRA